MKKSFDMLVENPGLCEGIKALGFDGACFIGENPGVADFYSAGIVSGEVVKSARKILEKHDLAYYNLGELTANRRASECWELDAMVCSPDFLKESRPGKRLALDYVSLKNMSERGIALIIPLSITLRFRGFLRASTINTLINTVRLAGKAGVKVITASGAANQYQLRSSQDLACFSQVLGVPEHELVRTVSSNPEALISKSADRRDPDVITSGLRVIKWGLQMKNQGKRMYGWY